MKKEKLIADLKRLADELGKSPTAVECNACPYTANVSTYRTNFGSWNEAKRLAGIETLDKFSDKSTEELLASLQKFYSKEGRAPTQKECRNSNGLFGPNTYKDRFGGWQEAIEAAGIAPSQIRSNQVSDDWLLDSLKEYYVKFGRAPTHEDCNDLSQNLLKSHMVYARRFGTFTNALELAGVPANPSSSVSKGEKDLLDSIKSFYTGTIEENSKILRNSLEIDIYLPDIKLGIEFNGLYWHGDSHKDKNYHKNKTISANALGIRLIHIFESEWKQKKSIVLNRLRYILGASDKQVYARNCVVREVPRDDARTFLEDNHIQGYAPSTVRLGLYHNETLVAVQTFCKSRFTKDCEWELLRYSGLVVGGASKLLKYFESKYTPKSIVSYSDIRWNTGSLYYKLGFTLSHISDPNYFYFKGTKLESRHGFQKHKLEAKLKKFDPSLSEVENMKLNGYSRIFDCGNMVFKKYY